ncbi:MAG TPA: fibronectin type III domain-containing protein [Thermoanaerobaculia bacterium]|nr:fibronectin type III domain-containing protein [Thermoanaerobaculia bacterium]
MLVVPEGLGDDSNTPPPRFVEKSAVAPIISMSPARETATSNLRSLRTWNRSGKLPIQNGFSRDFSHPLNVLLSKLPISRTRPLEFAGGVLSQSASGDLLWGTKITVESSYRLSLHLSDVRLPRGTRFWVYGTEDYDIITFDLDQLSGTEIWTPSVEGPTVHLEVQVPASAFGNMLYGFNIARVLEVFDIGNRSNVSTNLNQTLADCPIRTCLRNADCVRGGIPIENGTHRIFTSVDTEMKAIAHLRITRKAGPGHYVSQPCTGALINDNVPETTIPYMLTADHCLYEKTVSIEAFFDDIAPCSKKALSLSTLPRATARIVERVPNVDLALLKVDKIPAGRTLLGWYDYLPNSGHIYGPEASSFLHRLHHPCDLPMHFSWEWGTSSSTKCPDSTVPRYPKFLVSAPYLTFFHNEDIIEDHPYGAIWGGSSGSPLLGGSKLYGALSADCPGKSNNCKEQGEERLLNGSLGVGLTHLRKYLDPSRVPAAPSNLQAKIIDNGKSVILSWKDNTRPPTNFLIEMRKDNGNFGDFARLSQTSFTFTPSSKGTYFFRVLVESEGGNSFPSNVMVVKFRPR